ncbi:MAG: nicotinate-nucleotide--dimethylbenzimidazole phosphoribosyltransferase [Oscillospiraceae bacterium]|nr:nicotinate-nucleotide--dimethylbenzimidazole phosphoribosyltransferase [Oscillospiraceae bacterium]
MNFRTLNKNLPPIDSAAGALARAKWDAIAKPLGSLGLLEDYIVKIAALTGDANVRLRRRAVLVLCADNGVVAEGVTQTDSNVTMLVAESLTRRGSAVCLMAEGAGADVFAVDMGMNTRPGFEGLIDRRIADGTKNLAHEPAMTREQAERAVLCGIELAEDMSARGYDIVCTGEMGIGNTTTAAAVCAALLSLDAEAVTGRGAGLSDEGLERKKRVIRDALAFHAPEGEDVIGTLSKVGGFDIAGMAGIFIGGARCGLPVVIDGFISSVAALTAARLCPGCAGAMLASHVSGEPAGQKVLRALDLAPLITAGMRLGEGTGAVSALPLLDLALCVYHGSASFGELGMSAYEKL